MGITQKVVVFTGSTMILGSAKQVIHDFREYLRAYWAYVFTSVGLGKASAVAIMWVTGIFVPLGANTFLPLPVWLRLAWMAGWGLLSYICAPFGMWKHHRAQIAGALHVRDAAFVQIAPQIDLNLQQTCGASTARTATSTHQTTF
jgi:hypothetical protein